MQENNKRHSEKYNHLFARSPFCSNAHDLFFIRFKKMKCLCAVNLQNKLERIWNYLPLEVYMDNISAGMLRFLNISLRY